jgi:hypothetical protein
MNVGQLIKKLEAFDPEKEVMILDGFNGGGTPRTINLGPNLREVTKQDADEASDCEDLVGQTVVRMGYGFY